MDNGLTARLSTWFNQPFSSSMTAVDWALFVGFVLIVIAGWKLVLLHLRPYAAME